MIACPIMKNGILTLIPTPIDDETPLEQMAHRKLLEACQDEKSIIVVEEARACRRRWVRWELPREAIDNFVLYNEHNVVESANELYRKLKDGYMVYLMSDCGIPAFCDPGRYLVDLCHNGGVKVTSTPFCNSIALAVALSGFHHDSFNFEGFIPVKDGRKEALKRIAAEKRMTVIMDTPYRLKRILQEFEELLGNREVFLGMDLNCPSEELMRATVPKILKKVTDFKREFVLLISPIGNRHSPTRKPTSKQGRR